MSETNEGVCVWLRDTLMISLQTGGIKPPSLLEDHRYNHWSTAIRQRCKPKVESKPKQHSKETQKWTYTESQNLLLWQTAIIRLNEKVCICCCLCFKSRWAWVILEFCKNVFMFFFLSSCFLQEGSPRLANLHSRFGNYFPPKCPSWCNMGSNPQPQVYKTVALTTAVLYKWYIMYLWAGQRPLSFRILSKKLK